jgi:ABC-2 type transport system permease protein
MYTKQLDFLQNTVDWSLEDRDLLALRGRTQFARTLAPLDDGTQRFWEYGNYALALLGLMLVRLWRHRVAKADRQRYARIIGEV